MVARGGSTVRSKGTDGFKTFLLGYLPLKTARCFTFEFCFSFCRFDRRVCTVISMILAGVFCLIFSVASVAFLKAGIDYVGAKC